MVSLASAWSVSYADLVTLLQRDAKVWERVQRSMEARKEWAAEAILRELRDLAMSDLRQAFDESGALKPPDQWPDSLARAISSIEIDEFYEGRGDERTQVGWTKKIKLWDKPAALKQLREHLAAGLGAAATGGEMSLESMIEASISGYERARDKILRERAAAGRASESVDIEAEAVSVESDEPL